MAKVFTVPPLPEMANRKRIYGTEAQGVSSVGPTSEVCHFSPCVTYKTDALYLRRKWSQVHDGRGDVVIAMLHAGVSGTWGVSWGLGRVAGICEGAGLSEVVAAPDPSRMLSLLCCPCFHNVVVSKCC